MLSYTNTGFAVASDANEGVPVTAKAQVAVRGLKIGCVDKVDYNRQRHAGGRFALTKRMW